jgi:predicted dehydrogenase
VTNRAVPFPRHAPDARHGFGTNETAGGCGAGSGAFGRGATIAPPGMVARVAPAEWTRPLEEEHEASIGVDRTRGRRVDEPSPWGAMNGLPADPSGIGLIGCGTISGAYLRTLTRAPGVRVVAVADLDPVRARTQADAFGVPLALDPAALLALDEVDLVIDLTVPAAHYDVNRAALEAGKLVYSEKPLAKSADEARALLALADRVGRPLGGAPDTFLGAGLQTVIGALAAGTIGRPFAAVAHMVSRGPERWHPDPGFFYQAGAGPLLDMGPYYVTALVALFGPVASVSAEGGRLWSERVVGSGPRAGERLPVAVDTHVTLLLRFVSGEIATLLTSFDVAASDLPRFEVFGEEGTLAVPDPNTFGGPVRQRSAADEPWRELPLVPGFTTDARGIGALELRLAAASGRAPRASAGLASHVLDVLDGALRSARLGRRVEIDSRPERPAPLADDDLAALGLAERVAA